MNALREKSSTVYEFRRFSDDKDLHCCDCCGYPAPLHTFQIYAEGGAEPGLHRRAAQFCEICSSSFISSSYEYPRQYPGAKEMQATAFCTNAILDQLGAFKDSQTTLVPEESDNDE